MEVNDLGENIIENTTCFSEHLKRRIACEKNNCRQWMNSKKDHNCALIGAYDGRKTLRVVGEIFGVTRMRICQIEKSAIKKLDISK